MFPVTTDVALRSGVSSWRRRVIVQLVCVLLLCFFLCLERNDSLMRTVVKVDVARFQNRLE